MDDVPTDHDDHVPADESNSTERPTISDNQNVELLQASETSPRVKVTETNATFVVVYLDRNGRLAVTTVRRQHKIACAVETESGAFCYRVSEEISAGTTRAVIEIESAIEASTNDEQTCGEKFCAICTSRINGSEGLAPMVETNPSTRKAQRDGRKLFKELVFPLFSKNISEIVTYGNFLIALVLFLITIITLAVSSTKTIVDFVYVGFSAVSWLLTSMDLIIAIYFHRCKLACDVYKCCKRCRDTDELSATPMCCIDGGRCDVNVDFAQIEAEPSGMSVCADGGHCDRCCKLCFKNKYADLVRLLLIEVFVYPITICSMLNVFLNIHLHHQDGIDAETGLGITLFAVSAFCDVFPVYVLRSFVILRTICAIDKFRKDGPVAKTARSFHKWFFAHVIQQMLAQILMIVCIGAKMYYENRKFAMDNTVRISPYLWYMIIGGFFIPLAGVFTFVIYGYYYVQEYSIGFFIDLLYTVVNIRVDLGMSPEAKEDAKKLAQKIERDYTEIHEVSTVYKYGYVFLSPLLVALSIVYILFLLAFAICCVLEPDPVSGVTNFVILNGSTTGWVVFFAVGILLVNLLNLFVLLVAGWWIAIITAVIVVIALVISLILLLIYLIVICIIMFIVYKFTVICICICISAADNDD